MPKSKHKAIIDSLNAKFPHLKKEIHKSARAIYDAQKISDACAAGTMKFEKGQNVLKGLSKSGALPAQVGKWFLTNLDPPAPKKKVSGKDIWHVVERAALESAKVPGTDPYEYIESELSKYLFQRDYALEHGDLAWLANLGVHRFLMKETLPQETRGELFRDINDRLKKIERKPAKPTEKRVIDLPPEGPEAPLDIPPAAAGRGPTGTISVNTTAAGGGPLVNSEAVLIPVAPETFVQAQRKKCKRNGKCEFTNLPMGTYRVEVSHPKFQTYTLETTLSRAAPVKTLGIGLQRAAAPEAPPAAGPEPGEEIAEFPEPELVAERALGPTGILKGKIKDTDGLPIPGILVRVGGRSGRTNRIGEYRIEGIPPGTHTATAKWERADVTIVANQETTQDFTLLTTAEAVGKVQPIKYAAGEAKVVGAYMARETKKKLFRKHVTMHKAFLQGRRKLYKVAKSKYDGWEDEQTKRKESLKKEFDDAKKNLKTAVDQAKKAFEDQGAAEAGTDLQTKMGAVTAIAAPELAAAEGALDTFGKDSEAKGKLLKGDNAVYAEAMREQFENLKGIRQRIVNLAKSAHQVFGPEIKELLDKKAGEIATELKLKYYLNDSEQADLDKLLKGEAATFADHFTRAVEHGAQSLLGSISLAYKGSATSTNVGRNVVGYFFVEWWGPIAWLLLLAAGLSQVGLVVLLIWGILKIPAISTGIVLWIQWIFLLSGSFLGLFTLPGYFVDPQVSPITFAGIGAVGNLLLNLNFKSSAGSLFEDTLFAQLFRFVNHIFAGGVIGFSVYMFMLSLGFAIPGPTPLLIGFGILAALVLVMGLGGGAGGAMPGGQAMLPLLIIVGTVVIGFVSGFEAALFTVLLLLGMTNFYPIGDTKTINTIALVVLVFAYFAIGPYSGFVIEAKDQTIAPIKAMFSVAGAAVGDIFLLITNPTEYFAQQQVRAVRPEKPISFPEGVEIVRLDAVPPVVPQEEQFTLFVAFQNEGDLQAREIRARATCVESAPREAKRCKPIAAFPNYTAAVLTPGQGDRHQWTFVAQGRPEAARIAEAVFNHVNLTLSYVLDTSSSLQTEITTPDELTRRQRQPGGRFYYPQVATAKVGPAQVAINVGPQPLIQGREASVIIAITNARPDGNVIFRSEKFVGSAVRTQSRLNITLSPIVGSDLRECQSILSCRNVDSNKIECTSKENTYRLERFETRSVIPVTCKFTVADLPPETGSLTGLITATLENYQFDLLQSKSVQVTAPLGLLPVEPQTPQPT